jgi:hypothetical protein
MDPEWREKLASEHPHSGDLGTELWTCFLDVFELLEDLDEDFGELAGNHKLQAVYFHKQCKEFQDAFDNIAKLIGQIESYAHDPLAIQEAVISSLDPEGEDEGILTSEMMARAEQALVTIRRTEIPEIFIPDCVLILQTVVGLMPEVEMMDSSSGKTPERRYTTTALGLLDRVSRWILRLNLVAETYDRELTANVRLIREDVKKAREMIEFYAPREVNIKDEEPEEIEMPDAQDVTSDTEGNGPPPMPHSHQGEVQEFGRNEGNEVSGTPAATENQIRSAAPAAEEKKIMRGKKKKKKTKKKQETKKMMKVKKKDKKDNTARMNNDAERAWTPAEHDSVLMALVDGEPAVDVAAKLHRSTAETEKFMRKKVSVLVSRRLKGDRGVVPKWLAAAEEVYFPE